MASKEATDGEGDWCAVPLQRAGYGLGLIARSDGKGRALGYFSALGESVRPSSPKLAGCDRRARSSCACLATLA